MSRVIEKAMDMFENNDSIDKILKFIIEFVKYFNEDESRELMKFVNKLTVEEKYNFFHNLCEEGVNIHIPPMLWNDSIYNKLQKIYNEQTWIKPYKVYIKQFGRYIEMLNPLYTGSMYIMKLKQSAKKGLSVRSTGHVSHRGLPEKTKRSHRELYSKTPIRIGGDENNNMNIGVSSEIINQLHTFYRSSPHGRHTLAEFLAGKVNEPIMTQDVTKETPLLSNRNVEILNAYNKILGVKLVFEDPNRTMMLIDTEDRQEIHELKDGSFIMGSEKDKVKANIRIDVIRKLQKETKDLHFMTSEEYEEYIEQIVEKIYNSK